MVNFLHVSKTGGTAIKFALRPYIDAGCYTIRLHPHRVTFADIPAGEKIFFFVREPETRFVSGFYSRQRQGLPRIYVPWTVGEARAFARFTTANDLAKGLSSEDRQIYTEARDAMQAIAHARRSYSHWFVNESYLRQRVDDILFIGFQEQLSDDFHILKQLLRLPDEVTLPAHDIAAHRNPPTIDRHLDQDARVNLAIWYEQDQRILELCRRLRECLAWSAWTKHPSSTNSATTG